MRKIFKISILSFLCLAFALLTGGCATDLITLVESSSPHVGHSIFHSVNGVMCTLSAIGLIKVVRE